jgi:hypothetical protein
MAHIAHDRLIDARAATAALFVFLTRLQKNKQTLQNSLFCKRPGALMIREEVFT